MNPAREIKTEKFSRTEGKRHFDTEKVRMVLDRIDTSRLRQSFGGWKGLMNPSRRSCLYRLNGLRYGQPRRQCDTCTNQTVPTGRLFLGGVFPSHFVQGYNRTVPPKHLATGSSLASAGHRWLPSLGKERLDRVL
jgi:hypothetical protein